MPGINRQLLRAVHSPATLRSVVSRGDETLADSEPPSGGWVMLVYHCYVDGLGVLSPESRWLVVGRSL